jgi:peptidoglycan biosynthesis protein MviN/MurJ (putative lipid II flippase)
VAPAVIATLINLSASLFLTWRFGLIGPVLGTLVANLAVNSWYLPTLLRRSFGVSPGTLVAAVGWPLAWGLPYATGLWWIAHAHRPWGWPGLIAEMSGAALGFLALSSVVILSSADRALWRLRLLGLLELALKRRDRMTSDR